jgi:hypothetical protein
MRIKEWISDKLGAGRIEQIDERRIREGFFGGRSLQRQEARKAAAAGLISGIDHGLQSVNSAFIDAQNRYTAAQAAGDFGGAMLIQTELGQLNAEITSLHQQRAAQMERYNSEDSVEQALRTKHKAIVEKRDATLEKRSRKVVLETMKLEGRVNIEKKLLERAEQVGGHLLKQVEMVNAAIVATEERMRASGVSERKIDRLTKDMRKKSAELSKQYEKRVGPARKQLLKASEKFSRQKREFDRYEAARRENRARLAPGFAAPSILMPTHLETPQNHVAQDYSMNLKEGAPLRSWLPVAKEHSVAGMLADWGDYLKARKSQSLAVPATPDLDKLAKLAGFSQDAQLDPRDLRVVLMRYYLEEGVNINEVSTIVDDFENRTLKKSDYHPLTA